MLHHRNPTLPSPLSLYFTEQHRPPRIRETPLANEKVPPRKPTTAVKVAPRDSPRRTHTRTPKDIALINSELELAEKRNKVKIHEVRSHCDVNCRKQNKLWQAGRLHLNMNEKSSTGI